MVTQLDKQVITSNTFDPFIPRPAIGDDEALIQMVRERLKAENEEGLEEDDVSELLWF